MTALAWAFGINGAYLGFSFAYVYHESWWPVGRRRRRVGSHKR